jgi:hypothetical protein
MLSLLSVCLVMVATIRKPSTPPSDNIHGHPLRSSSESSHFKWAHRVFQKQSPKSVFSKHGTWITGGQKTQNSMQIRV